LFSIEDERYRTLVYYFSQRCPEKYTKEAVDEAWEDSRSKHYDISIRMLERWAKEDAPKRYEEVKRAGAFAVLQEKVFEYKGDIHDCVVADLLKILLRGKYIVGIPPGKGAQPQWYEFMTEEDKHKAGEAYKYRYLSSPVNMKTYISHAIPSLYNTMIEHIKKRIDAADEPTKNKYLVQLKKNLESSKVRLTKDNFNRCVINAAVGSFYDPEFLDKLDSDGNIMGVGNGIILLGNKIKLIRSYHEYAISRYTPVPYRLHDESDEWVKKIHNAFHSIIPEEDAFLKIMFYLSSGLDGKTKESLILFLVGGGANGKSFLLEMVSNALGEKYARKMPIKFITGGRGDAQGPNPGWADRVPGQSIPERMVRCGRPAGLARSGDRQCE